VTISEIDELQHLPSDDWLWRESLHFSFHDVSGKLGGLATIGVLPNQKRVEGFAAIFPSAPSILLYRTEDPTEGKTGLFSVRGIGYDMLAPLQRWHLVVNADFSQVEPEQLISGTQVPEAKVPAGFDLTFDARSPAYQFPVLSWGLPKVAAQRFEQTGRMKGTVFIGGKTFPVNGLGFRDHFWGSRDWPGLSEVVAVHAQFSSRLTVNAVWGIEQGQRTAAGYVSRDGVNIPIRDVEVDIEVDPLSSFPRAARAEVTMADGGRLRLHAVPRSVLPLLLRQGEGELHGYECSTCFDDGRQIGYGTMEVTRLMRGAQDSGD